MRPFESAPHVEIFRSEERDQTPDTCFWNEADGEPMGSGWFFWSCWPGCMPEGDPMGPFRSYEQAEREASEFFDVHEEGCLCDECRMEEDFATDESRSYGPHGVPHA